MKRKSFTLSVFRYALYLIAWMPVVLKGQTVPQLQIVQLNMPIAPGDTAFENQTYQLFFSVTNLSPVVAQADTVFIIAFNPDTTVQVQQHILASDVAIQLGQGMIQNLFNPGYQFSPANYKQGGNIVVVWPRLGNDPNTTADSIVVSVFFVPVPATSFTEPELSVSGLLISYEWKQIRLLAGPDFFPERVRIYDLSGRIIHGPEKPSSVLHLPWLEPGIYILEWKTASGKWFKHRFGWF